MITEDQRWFIEKFKVDEIAVEMVILQDTVDDHIENARDEKSLAKLTRLKKNIIQMRKE